MEKINVVVTRPGDPQIWELEFNNNLEAFQTAVGGYIEIVALQKGLVLILNEEGKLEGLHPNLELLGGDVVVGNVVIAATDGEDFVSMTTEQRDWALSWVRGCKIL